MSLVRYDFVTIAKMAFVMRQGGLSLIRASGARGKWIGPTPGGRNRAAVSSDPVGGAEGEAV